MNHEHRNPRRLAVQLEETARAQGKPVDELVADAVRNFLAWPDTAEIGECQMAMLGELDDTLSDEEFNRVWAAEAQRRLAEIDAGKSTTIKASDLHAEIRRRFGVRD